ncbi:DAK2 domain-containing protein [Isoptericola sp. S6320L]|uniref:DAK2 domain-containing protein n=1 Tax=Isoptericola sp. S6320L TaxID=2926411 RepID=UPI001FF3C178|nr:DAK2 domain-containing protein [Isoptericola sp. S6320L]MCK0118735.1 DAK2 domain-containing protein [Isoptericola sp. S6320L]
MVQPELLDASVVRAWARGATDALASARTELDGVNVFPVADGDTGTNMYLTVREAGAAIHDADDGASGARLLRLGARAALLQARGNSGVILSEWWRGLALAASRRDSLGVALDVAARSARRAVAHPASGTILTAADSAAAAARHAEAGGMVGPLGAPERLTVLDAARRGAREAALRSVGTLAPLRDAGVLDAGACGLLLILAALAEAQRHAGAASGHDGVSAPGGIMAPVLLDLDLTGYAPADGGADTAVAPPGEHGEVPAADEVELMFVLHRAADAAGFRPGAVADALRADLDEVGNSVVVVGGGAGDATGEDVESVWQAHVHTPELDRALEVARRWSGRGAVSRVHVRHLAVPPADWAVVTTTSAPALATELASGGAVVLLDLDVPPTREDLAQAVLGAGTPHVLVLAPPAVLGDGGLQDAVDALGGRDGVGDGPAAASDVVVVPAASDVHLVTAVAALAGALDAAGSGGEPADVPGVVRGALDRLRAARPAAAAAPTALTRLVSALGADAGIVALLPDRDVPAAVVDALAEQVAAVAAGADVVVLPTGRAGDHVGIGVEPAEDPGDEPAIGALSGEAW